MAVLPPGRARLDGLNSLFLANGRRIPAPIAKHPGAKRREDGQAVSPRRIGSPGPNGVEPVFLGGFNMNLFCKIPAD